MINCDESCRIENYLGEAAENGMKRKEFVRLCTGIVTGLGLYGVTDDCAGAEQEADTRVNGDLSVGGLDDSYLVRGLTGMAKAKGWFDAHWGMR